MGLFGERDRKGRVTMLIEPSEAEALLAYLDLPEEEPDEDDEDARMLKAGDDEEHQLDKWSLRKRLERAAGGRSNPQLATGSPGTERHAQEWDRGY